MSQIERKNYQDQQKQKQVELNKQVAQRMLESLRMSLIKNTVSSISVRPA